MSDTSSTTNSTGNPIAYTTQTPIPSEPPKPTPPDATKPDEGKPQFTQADVDRFVQQRVAKFQDYDDIKTKLTEFEDRDKSELDRAAAARDEALAEAAKAGRELSIYRAAAKHGVPAEYVDLIDGDTDEAIDAKAQKVAELAKAQTADPLSTNRYADPGQSPHGAPDEDAVKEAFARQLFKVERPR